MAHTGGARAYVLNDLYMPPCVASFADPSAAVGRQQGGRITPATKVHPRLGHPHVKKRVA